MAYSSVSQHPNARFPGELADVRGFEVRTRDDGGRVGRVRDLVCSPDGRVRYLDVGLGGFFKERHVALPVGAAQVDAERDVVWVTGLSKAQIKALPDYAGDAAGIDDRYEGEVRGAAGAAPDADLYDHGHLYAERGGERAREARVVLSEERLSVSTRRVDAGEVGVHKTVETERVRRTVPVMREEVTIERHPVTADAAAHADLAVREDHFRAPADGMVVHRPAATERQTADDAARLDARGPDGRPSPDAGRRS
jgi:uncharacterized protein (TIGR02271 family)